MLRVLLMAVLSCALTAAIGWFLLPVLRALKAGQSIREVGPTWHNSKAGTPMMGGLMFIFAAVLIVAGNAFFMEEYSVVFVLILALCFGFVGFLDDFTKIKYKRNLGLTSIQKAALQAAVSALFLYIMFKTGAMSTELYIPFVDLSFTIHPILYIFLSMFIMVGCVNAVNLTDGVDGLCGSVTIPVMIFFTMAAIALGKYDLAVLPASLAGGLAAYLVYNWHPAKVFMGDTGSLFLGGVVCAMAFALEMPLILVLVGIIYIVETVSVILQVGYFKLTHGKRLFKMSPIHHHFEMCGWKEEKICGVFTAVSAVMCVLAWIGISGLFG
ncbi:MAG: phospho-N-acetylmuramoyl-pentapeptide-transferase [Oscillospiraceae bacterium]|nr:phospho-N-acetylmuramoyl-pentapeptide-transferase [Oscillospiraceae bacterium]MBQ7129669.1 phospho-N-acetylmuramoyl-pentapeptide-transferase [Oscillospiraceae bacterium]